MEKIKKEEEKIEKRGRSMGLLLPLRILLVSLIVGAPRANAWGKEGHFMVCKIAEQYLTDKTLTAVSDLLPPVAEGDLASVCSWADQMRFRYRWASPLHYINTPGVCNFKYSRDCHNSKGEKDMCVAGAISNYTAQLQTYGDSSSGYNLTESLMFLAHFVGDIHQPLHVGFEDDEGGNTIIVHWYRRKSNLHHVWDVSMIETAMKDYYNDDLNTMLEAIQMNITSDKLNQWETCSEKLATCVNQYATESITLACDYAYKDVEQDSTLEDDYFFSRLPVVEERIAQGGVRLATILNEIFDGSSAEIELKLSRAARVGRARQILL
ncbi:putative bifunctional nuclease precursor [Iris pallida]|uniref:Aspergillus nuclease S1 n=1 Tax=Iris pallida TaxID=29817 RepID=A0AAX6GBQ9_IRIPA|nr:putative bifunctional nuclease precursor [Iris pallida]